MKQARPSSSSIAYQGWVMRCRSSPLPSRSLDVATKLSLKPSQQISCQRISSAPLWFPPGVLPSASAPDILCRTPVFKGTRVRVAALLDYLAAGDPLERFLDHFPYAICNEESTAWHEGFGFRELPDLGLAHLHRSYFAGEMRRCEVDASVSVAERKKLCGQYDFWKLRAAELEAICERDGFDAVTPLRQFTW